MSIRQGNNTIAGTSKPNIVHYLGLWDATTGTAQITIGYVYQSGDYFIVGDVPSSGSSYIPSGSSYTGASSATTQTTIFTEDMYFYNGTVWELLKGNKESNSEGAVGVPQIANVTIKPKNNMLYHSWETNTNHIVLSLNLNKDQIKEKMNDLYIGIERFVRQRSNKEDQQKPKFCMVNDRRPHITKKMYAYKVYVNVGYPDGDPRNYYYFYTPIEYTVQELEEQNPPVFSYMGELIVGGKATCLNELLDNYAFSDFNVGTVYRASALDIDVFANPGNAFLSNYAEKLICRKYKIAGGWQFLWCANWLRGSTTVYGWAVNAFENDYQNMTVFGTVSDYDEYDYTRRDEMNCWRLIDDDFVDFVESLYGQTMQGHGYGDLHVHWNCYWLDAPIAPILLRDMYVFKRDDTGDGAVILSSLTETDWEKLPKHPKFMLPWTTEYIWLRFCGYQKRCIYKEYSDILDEDLTITQKDILKFIYEHGTHSANPAFAVRPFGRQNNGYRFSEHAKIQEYIQFNLYEPDCVSIGKISTSTPVQKKLYLSCFTGANGIRD